MKRSLKIASLLWDSHLFSPNILINALLIASGGYHSLFERDRRLIASFVEGGEPYWLWESDKRSTKRALFPISFSFFRGKLLAKPAHPF